MGVEWSLGCLKCKRQIWLGSQKPFKWKGFQIGDENVQRFLFLHSKCESDVYGNLLLTNDGTSEVPWEDDDERLEWKEDILSRTFCFDSWNQEGLICAHCSEKLEADEENRKLKGNLMKNAYLWFCNEACFDHYVEFNRNEREHFIYDSTFDALPLTRGESFEVGCTMCKSFVVIDNQDDSNNILRDFEYLASFLTEHVGLGHKLKVGIDDENIAWRNPGLVDDWIEYQY